MVRLEIVGGIGAGKTTLARVLAEAWSSHVVHEDVLNVPFFSKFYAAPQVYGFEKNISFLLSHADLIRDAAGKGEDLIVCDFALFQDLSYTDIGCSPADADAIEAVYHRLIDRVGYPALVVHLQSTPDTSYSGSHSAPGARKQALNVPISLICVQPSTGGWNSCD